MALNIQILIQTAKQKHPALDLVFLQTVHFQIAKAMRIPFLIQSQRR
jgi:hypothetical protein